MAVRVAVELTLPRTVTAICQKRKRMVPVTLSLAANTGNANECM